MVKSSCLSSDLYSLLVRWMSCIWVLWPGRYQLWRSVRRRFVLMCSYIFLQDDFLKYFWYTGQQANWSVIFNIWRWPFSFKNRFYICCLPESWICPCGHRLVKDFSQWFRNVNGHHFQEPWWYSITLSHGQRGSQLHRLAPAAHLVRHTQCVVGGHALRAQPAQSLEQIRGVVVFWVFSFELSWVISFEFSIQMCDQISLRSPAGPIVLGLSGEGKFEKPISFSNVPPKFGCYP